MRRKKDVRLARAYVLRAADADARADRARDHPAPSRSAPVLLSPFGVAEREQERERSHDGCVELRELLQRAGDDAEFFFEFARRGLFGSLAGVELARREFEHVADGRVTVLADERDRAVIAVRDYRGPARMAHDLAHVSLGV